MTLFTGEPDDCQCRADELFSEAGIGFRLCHHASAAELETAESRLAEMLSKFNQDIDLTEIVNKPLPDAVAYYIEASMGSGYAEIRNTPAELILQAGFLRQYGITIQALAVGKLQDIREVM